MDTPTPDGGTQNIRCPRCATLIRAGAHFCRTCGAPVARATMRHPGIGSNQLDQAIPQPKGGTVTEMPDNLEALQGRISDQPAQVVKIPGQTSHGPTPHEGDGKAQATPLAGAPAPIPRHCPLCQTVLPTGSHYCGACGHSLDTRASQGVEKSSRPLQTSPAGAQETPPATPVIAVDYQQTPTEKKVAKGAETKEQQGEGPLTILDKVVLLQAGLVAILLVAQFLPLPRINSGVFAEGGAREYEVPLFVFLILAISLAIGYCCMFACALRARWSVRFLVVLLGTGLLAIQPVIALRAGTERSTTESWLSYAQLGTLALFWVWALSVPLYRRYVKQVSLDFIGVIALLLIYYGLAFVHANKGGTDFLLDTIGAQVLFLPLFFVLLMLLNGTSLLSRGQTLARTVLFTKQNGTEQLRSGLARYLPALTALVAVGMIVYEVLHAGSGLLPGLLSTVVLAGIVVLLVRFAKVDSSWPKEVPSMCLFLGALFIVIDVALLADVNPFSEGLRYLIVTISSQLLTIPIALGALTIALFLVVRGRMGQPKRGAVGFFLAMIALLVLTAELLSAPALLDTGLSVSQQHYYLLGAMIVFAALGILAWMIRSRRQLKETTLATVFLLLVGLLIVEALYALLTESATLGSFSIVLLALIFLLPTLLSSFKPLLKKHFHPKSGTLLSDVWSSLTADEQEADSENTWFFPEGKKALLLTGYVLISNAVFLYLGTLREPITNAVPPPYLGSDLTASAGLILLGPALVVLGFILRMRQHVPHISTVVLASQPARRVSPRAMQFGIVGSGMLVTVLVTIFLLTTALPRLIQTSENQRYTATPGPDCDLGGAIWSEIPGEQISTTCIQAGFQVMVKAQSAGTVEFIPPSGVFTQNYRVSVQVNLSHLSNGCVSIETRFAPSRFYSNLICSSGLWGIRRIIGSSDTLLAVGNLERATTYTLEATADGANQRLAIDGMVVGSVSDTTLVTTAGVNLGILNSSGEMESAVFSNFVFTPLPALPFASSQITYRAHIPGAACDKGGAQWALMNPLEAQVACHSDGMQLKVQSRQQGLVAFTPPGGIFPRNYGVSVQIDPSALLAGCVGIETRATACDYYWNGLCKEGSLVTWKIAMAQSDTRGSNFIFTTKASGQLAPASTYTLEATADGSQQQLAINGSEVGTLSDTTLSTTAFVALQVETFLGGPASASFSNFVITPLP
jgi:hypothetical protein